MACLLVMVWIAVFVMMVRAVILKDILWPQKQEDREEGGWKTNPTERQACDVMNCEPSRISASGVDVTEANGTITHGRAQHQEYSGAAISDGDMPHSHMPSIPEGLMEQSIRGKAQRLNDDPV